MLLVLGCFVGAGVSAAPWETGPPAVPEYRCPGPTAQQLAVAHRTLAAHARLLRAEIGMLEARLRSYGPQLRLDHSAVAYSRDDTQLLILQRRMRLAAIEQQLRDIGRARAW
jgi:hypothetical protein